MRLHLNGLPLRGVFLRALLCHMTSDHAATDCADHGVMPGVMPGHTTDDSALQASGCLCRSYTCYRERGCNHYRVKSCYVHEIVLNDGLKRLRDALKISVETRRRPASVGDASSQIKRRAFNIRAIHGARATRARAIHDDAIHVRANRGELASHARASRRDRHRRV